jgi:transcriptional regulator with XRE-family HTH domain
VAEQTLVPGVLRAWRDASGMRPEQVCVLAEVSYSYLRALEQGYYFARNPSVAVLTRLAAVYGRDVRELFDPAGAR